MPLQTNGERTEETAAPRVMTPEAIQERPFNEVKATLRKQARTQAVSQEQSQVESQARQVASSSDSDEESTSQGAQTSNADDESSESSQEREPGQAQRRKRKGTVDEENLTPEQWRERYQSLAANTHNTAEELRKLKEEREQEQRDRAYQQQASEYQNVINRIEQHPTATREQKDQAVQAYQQQLLMRAQNQFGEHVQTQAETVAQRERELQLREQRMALPGYVDSIVDFVSEQHDVPRERLSPITQVESFRNLLDNYTAPRDLAIIGEMLYVFGEYERAQTANAAESNRLGELDQYQQNNEPVRVVNRSGSGGGKTTAQKIEALPKGDWKKYQQAMKKYGNPTAAMTAVRAGEYNR